MCKTYPSFGKVRKHFEMFIGIQNLKNIADFLRLWCLIGFIIKAKAFGPIGANKNCLDNLFYPEYMIGLFEKNFKGLSHL